ncbi:MAG: stage III sporulation protein AE [Thermovenabulum sp.]|uniref:stage III sporulation protein AE n=1 Tax=Thermovenabulum sp. TaxID=3100335 RepID=UPI003C7CD89C
MRKKILMILIFILFFYTVSINKPNICFADITDEVESQLKDMELDRINSFLEEIEREYKDYMPSFGLNFMLDFVKGKSRFDVKSFFIGLLEYLFKEIKANYNLLAKLIAMAVVFAVLKNMELNFENKNISNLAHSVIYMVLIIIAVQSFYVALSAGKQAIEKMVSFMQSLLPVMMSLLLAVGGKVSTAVLHPYIFAAITASSTWIKDIILPIVVLIAILNIVNNISESFHVSQLAVLLKQVMILLIGLFLCVFLGTIVVTGAASSAVDGIFIRTMKFASKNLIPIVGGVFADTVDTVIGCSLIIKNMLSLAGLIVVIIITAFPILKIFSIVFIYRIAAAVIQPLGEKSLVKSLEDIANSLVLVIICIASVSIMFFIAITVILSAGNTATMMR